MNCHLLLLIASIVLITLVNLDHLDVSFLIVLVCHLQLIFINLTNDLVGLLLFLSIILVLICSFIVKFTIKSVILFVESVELVVVGDELLLVRLTLLFFISIILTFAFLIIIFSLLLHVDVDLFALVFALIGTFHRRELVAIRIDLLLEGFVLLALLFLDI